MTANLAVVLLAAGESSRLGQSKQLVSIGGKSLVRRATEILLQLEPDLCVVVTGADSIAVSAQLQDLPVILEYNALWKSGMATSIGCGVRALPGNIDGVLIFLCDQWRVDESDIHKLKEAWLDDTNAIVTSAWDEVCGPPTIFPARCINSLRLLKGDRGARTVLEEYPQIVKAVRLDNARYDLDTPEDLQSLDDL